MRRASLAFAAILGLSIGAGVAAAGVYLGASLRESRKPQRVVTVRGLAEREVDADLAIWPITFLVTSNELPDLYRRITEGREIVQAFLAGAGFSGEGVSASAPVIQDEQERAGGADGARPRFRFRATATVTLRSPDVALVKKTIESSGALVGRGVVLVAGDWENRTQYLFKGLNRIKPEMIEEATRNAREAAAKFAADSGSRLGKIQSASQGLFEITDRDPGTPERKQVRVVTSVGYFLVDE